jgi:hypothetical protein
MRIIRIDMVITLEDGTTVQGAMSNVLEHQRWGADIRHLAACVDPMEAMEQALIENDAWARVTGEDTADDG